MPRTAKEKNTMTNEGMTEEQAAIEMASFRNDLVNLYNRRIKLKAILNREKANCNQVADPVKVKAWKDLLGDDSFTPEEKAKIEAKVAKAEAELARQGPKSRDMFVVRHGFMKALEKEQIMPIITAIDDFTATRAEMEAKKAAGKESDE